jgi:CNT family concentrative nucleoside transporter
MMNGASPPKPEEAIQPVAGDGKPGELPGLAAKELAPPVLVPPYPLSWRVAISLAVVVLGGLAYLSRNWIGLRGQAVVGVGCFFGIVAVFSSSLRAVNWRTIGWGVALQFLLALFVIKSEPGYLLFDAVVSVVKKFLEFTYAGSQFVFGPLAEPAAMEKYFPKKGFVFFFAALPTVIFVASFFTVLYYFGILQFVVWLMAKAMKYLMGTSGSETLSVSANVFMGQTEAPLIIKPYVAGMTRSELLTMMVGGMAHISGALMAVYIGMGADPVAILATSVMAAPCSLYLSKLFLPELGRPETLGEVKVVVEKQHANVIDAAAAGASDGMRLALNIAAMLIAFLAFIAMINYLLAYADLSLEKIFSFLFAPVAFLMGVPDADVPRAAELLGKKLVANEFVAYTDFKEHAGELTERSRILLTYALTGFANFASIGIQLGGIGALAPSRRSDLARLGGKALFVGFLVTLLNASIAGILLDL